MSRIERIRELHRTRTRSRFLRLNWLVVLALVAAAWTQLDIRLGELFSPRRWENLQRFAGETYPFPLRGKPFDVERLWAWLAGIWAERGAEATAVTFDISVVAILLAGGTAAAISVFAARNLATTEPFLPAGRPSSRWRTAGWRGVALVCRGLLILARAIPEYIWAFLLVGMLGPGAWPAILALALHNFGILGKLSAELIENVDPAAPRALRGQGLSRSQISAVALFPTLLSKGLLFFFYRWETCVREATVLGMLGVASLGFWIRDARARDTYDEMMVFVVLGALLVLLGDLVSAITRRRLRNA